MLKVASICLEHWVDLPLFSPSPSSSSPSPNHPSSYHPSPPTHSSSLLPVPRSTLPSPAALDAEVLKEGLWKFHPRNMFEPLSNHRLELLGS